MHACTCVKHVGVCYVCESMKVLNQKVRVSECRDSLESDIGNRTRREERMNKAENTR